MLHNYRGPFPVPGLVDLGPYCGDVDYVSTVELPESSGLVIVGTEDNREPISRPGRRPRKNCS